MSLFTDASLVYVPSGVKNGKTYSITPTDGSGDLTFSRGSDIEATRISADGLIQKAQVNLLLQSNSFDTTWVGSSASVTSGQSGYDGTNDAWLLDSSAGYLYQSISATGVHTISIYVKAGTAEGFRIRVDQATDANYIIDLSDGSLISQSDNIAYKSTSVGGGWYRMEMAFLANTITNIQFRITDLAGATASGTAYIQDAQLNYGLVAQTYQETTTAAVVSGITDNMPRLNYDPANPTCPHLILEPSRTNVVTQSEYAASTLQNVTASYVESPEGVNNALRLTENSSTGQHYAEFNANVVSGTTYTISFFCKKGSYSQFTWPTQGSYMTGSISVNFDTETASVTGSDMISGSAFMEPYANGWYRVGFSGVPKISGNMDMYISISPNGVGSYTGDGVSYTDFYGFQCEAGSYSTSYIPTYGSSATRTADACSKTGISSLIGQTEGTIFLEFDNRLMTSYPNEYIFRIIGSDSDQIWLRKESGGAYFTARLITNSSTVIWTISSIPVPDGNTKIAISYKTGDSVLYLNGTQFGTSSATFSGTDFSDFYFNFSGTTNPELKLNQALLFKTRLSNADLATLTSL